MSTKEQNDRFEQTLNRLEELFSDPDFKGDFNMNSWGSHSGELRHKWEAKHGCGTSACLAGWMAVVEPSFRALFRRVRLINSRGFLGLNPKGYETQAPADDASLLGGSAQIYGLNYKQHSALFYGGNPTFADKMAEAREVLAENRKTEVPS